MKQYNQELELKLSLIRKFLEKSKLDGLLLRRTSSFSWASCGAESFINIAATEGAASLLVTHDRNFLLTNNIEAPRLEEESLLKEQGWEFKVSPWTDPLRELNQLITEKTIGADVAFKGTKNFGMEVAALRSRLTHFEENRMRQLGCLCAEAMTDALQLVRPGMSEYEIAAILGKEIQIRGAQPIVNLVATDERTKHYRHPLPTEKKLDKYALLVLCARKGGLIGSISRLVHFGPIPKKLRERIYTTAQVNSALICATHPGRTLGELLLIVQKAYASVGYPEEWQNHHQGGVTGYETREFLALPGAKTQIEIGQAIAWNPSIVGAKMEDTILVQKDQNEILTRTPNLPVVEIDDIPCALALEIL